jgi:chromosome segregation ATPase
MAAKKEIDSPLVAAARELDAELQDFERASRALGKAPLDSQRHLERAAKLLEEVATSEDRLQARLGSLVQAIGAARARREAQVASIQERAREIERRTGEFQKLLTLYGALGQRAASTHAKLASAREEAPDDASAALGGMDTELGALADDARALFEAARESEFTDVAKLADDLRQQIVSARSRLRRVHPQVLH